MTDDKYSFCSCGSGKKFKFCCYEEQAKWNGLSERELVRRATELPIRQCYINLGWQERGIAQVFVLREIPSGSVLGSSFSVDVYCLGIKYASTVRLKNDEVNSFLGGYPYDIYEIGYEDMRSVVLGAIEFAREFGFEPDLTWLASSAVVEPDRPFERKFEFGKDGRPLYIERPNDDVRMIMKKLRPLVADRRAAYRNAAGVFEEEIEVDDIVDEETDFREWCEEISCLMEDKYLRDARDEIEDMVAEYPDRREPFYLRGTCLTMQGKPREAVASFEQANAIEPSPETYLNLSAARESLLEVEEAIRCLRRVIEMDGEDGACGRLAKQRLDELAASIENRDGISLAEFLAISEIFHRACEHLRHRQFDEAIEGFSAVLKARPRHVQSHGNLGVAYAGKGERDRAIACFDRALEIDADYLPAAANRRLVLEASDLAQAVDSMQRTDFYESAIPRGKRRRRLVRTFEG